MPQPSPRTECLLQLVMVQLAALLQLTQLWTVLGGLTSAAPADLVSIADANDEGNWAVGLSCGSDFSVFGFQA